MCVAKDKTWKLSSMQALAWSNNSCNWYLRWFARN